MKTTLFFYTGTGNSLWTAQKIAGFLDGAELIALSRYRDEKFHCDAETIGLVFPVHIWGVPPPVCEFLKNLEARQAQYIFAAAVNAGQVAATLLQLQKILNAKNLHLSSGFSIDLPSNYIPWGGAIPRDRQQKKIAAALTKIERIAKAVRGRESLRPEAGAFLQNLVLSMIYKKSLPHVVRMDKSFFADEKCSSCGICAKICPAANIRLSEGKPVWRHRCEQCFACIQWCPEEAIQYGKGTRTKKRYHHPDISLKDMLRVSAGIGGNEKDDVKDQKA
ncbi:MAG: 4Fe-4S ferredoxin [Deltaproteobacteria bacterium]|nr:4Fe-4S ferredoxin [Deltaproteobacteria bacterium]